MSYNIQSILRDDLSQASVSVQTQIAPANNFVRAGRMTVGTGEVQLDLRTPIASCGYAIFINRGSTDSLSIGLATGDYLWEIPPTGFAICPLHSSKAANFFILSSGTADANNCDWNVRAA